MAEISTDEHVREFGGCIPPCPKPSAAAVEAGVFGFDEDSVAVPSLDDVRALTEEHARELISILHEFGHLQRCAKLALDPVSGRAPRGRARRQALVERLGRECEKLGQHYDDALAAYADGFGWDAAEELDRFVKTLYSEAAPRPRPMSQRELF